MFQMGNFQAFGKEQMDAMNDMASTYSRNVQQLAAASADFSKKQMEQGAAAMEKLMGVKTLDKAFEVQSDFAKQSYESYVAQAQKVNEMFAAMTKDAMKPFEGAFAKMGK